MSARLNQLYKSRRSGRTSAGSVLFDAFDRPGRPQSEYAGFLNTQGALADERIGHSRPLHGNATVRPVVEG